MPLVEVRSKAQGAMPNSANNEMDSLLKDISYGFRSLHKHPAFSIIVVLVLALGIGANTAIFSVVNSVLLRPLAYKDSDRLAMVWGNFRALNIERLPAKAAEYEDYRDQTQIFEQVAAFANASLNLTGNEQPERLSGSRVTSNLFSMLGAQAEQGRIFAADENQAGREKVIVLSHGFSQRHFGDQARAVGQTLRLNDEDYTIIGV